MVGGTRVARLKLAGVKDVELRVFDFPVRGQGRDRREFGSFRDGQCGGVNLVPELEEHQAGLVQAGDSIGIDIPAK